MLLSATDYRLMTEDNDTSDARLSFLLAQATAVIQRATKQTLLLVTDDTVTLSSNGRDVTLPQRPLVGTPTVAGYATGEFFVKYREVLRLGYPELGYRTAERSFAIDHLRGAWPEQVTVTYSHGYEVIPADLQGLVAAVVARAIDNPTGLRQWSIDDYSASYGTTVVAGVGLTADERMQVRRDYGRTSGTVRLAGTRPTR